ncbi:hypothetical protein HNP40_002493 [Mycobacteroides chelonae]|nr:hypothetical protein [Mycobacteroides chelonae]
MIRIDFKAATALFVVGAIVAPVGDHAHVVTGTTRYLVDNVPFVWGSPVWFPVLVGLATVGLAELRLHLPAPRTTPTVRQGVAGIAAVIGTYVVTALGVGSQIAPLTALIAALAALVWTALGDWQGALCGVVIAVVGPAVEIALTKSAVFEYTASRDGLWGVAPWLPPLYFAFGVVAALLGELAYKRRAADRA